MIILSKILFSVASVLLLTLLQNVLNARKQLRSRQLLMVPIAMVFSAGMIYWWCSRYPEIIAMCMQKEYTVDAHIVMGNLVLMAAFAVFKIIVCPVLTSLWRRPVLLELSALDFYQYDEEYNEWFLKNQWTNFRRYLFGLIMVSGAISGVIAALSWCLGQNSVWWVAGYPCAAMVILNEFYSYINGQTKEEFEHSVMGDEASSRRISNYYKIREILEQLLPEPLLTVSSGCDFSHRESANALIREMKESEDFTDQTVAEYFLAGNRYKTADVDCVYGTRNMMHRKNVVFLNPFYRDAAMYITLPMVTALLGGKKVLIICGRKTEAENTRDWVRQILSDYCHIESLWKVEFLTGREVDYDVGIITFSQVYDKQVLNTSREQLRETDFVLITEPSLMLATGQVGLSILAQEINSVAPAVYCICDRNTDGLVDTMSHVLRSEITEVVAMPVPRCTYTAMGWDSDGDFHGQQLMERQSKNLVNGIEIAATAVKNQVPKAYWISGSKLPMKDIKWLSGQNYSTLCRYMNIPVQQKSIYEKIEFVSDLWSVPKMKEHFCVVEDEFCNFFSMMRTFLSRGSEQSFVNVLSENYLLRDYMRCNQQMFMSNPNAVPSFVADYAKTERNTLMKLLLIMSLRPVTEEELGAELRLAGIETGEPFTTLLSLLHRYSFADDSIFTVKPMQKQIDGKTLAPVYCYSIAPEVFDEQFADTLKSAYFILEEEKGEVSYIDARLFNHVAQLVLPGQFVTYGGKYYMVKYVSSQSGVVLRRASNMFDGRKYYRQIRKYQFAETEPQIVSSRKVMDIEFSELRMNFSVETSGYLEMKANQDLRTARLVDFSQDPTVTSYTRNYKNKSVLRIRLPKSDYKTRFTLCLMLSEIFRSMYPDSWQYLAPVMAQPDDIDGMLNYVVYSAAGIPEDECIYIVEDSVLDMGLLSSVEKNYMKFMEILADFLDWHFAKMREPASKDPVPEKIEVVRREEKKKRTLVVRMLERIRKLFGGKREEEVEVKDVPDAPEAVQEPVQEVPAEEKPEDAAVSAEAETEEDMPGGIESIAPAEVLPEAAQEETDDTSENVLAEAAEEAQKLEEELHPEDEFEPKVEEDPDIAAIDGTDIFDSDGLPEHNDYLEACFQELGISELTRSRYQEECYLKYGFDEIDSRIQVDELFRYLRVHGWSNNALTRARKRDTLVRTTLDAKAVNHCDFCGVPLSGVSYEKLNDGRVRCNDCTSSAITTAEEFQELFHLCLSMMENFYDIRFRVPMRVKMTDAKTVARGFGRVFVPTTGVTPRVLGYAQRKNGSYSILIENGSPRLASIDTIVHEMTHIWQYTNWNDHEINSIYGMPEKPCTGRANDIVYEGMAMWASIQYLYLIGETYFAAQQEADAESRADAYGLGFRLYRERYPFVKDSGMVKYSPFDYFPPLEQEEVRAAAKLLCPQQDCKC